MKHQRKSKGRHVSHPKDATGQLSKLEHSVLSGLGGAVRGAEGAVRSGIDTGRHVLGSLDDMQKQAGDTVRKIESYHPRNEFQDLVDKMQSVGMGGNK